MARSGGISLGQIPIVDAPHSHAAAAKAVFVMDVPTYHKVLVVTDAAINIAPTLDDKGGHLSERDRRRQGARRRTAKGCDPRGGRDHLSA